MKKKIVALIVLTSLTMSVFAAKKTKANSFKFDFSKDFFPGVAYTILNGSAFKNAYLTKADVMKNEYTIEKVLCTAALVPITLTVNLTLQQDGTLGYEYSNLRYTKDNSKLEMTPLIAVNTIENQFDTLLPQVFGNDAAYEKAKEKCFSEAGMIFAMVDGLTEIRAAKFSEIVKGAKTNLPVTLLEAKMNDNDAYADYQYRLSTYIPGAILTNKVHLEYYTNDDDKAASANGDSITVSGTIQVFKKSKYGNYLTLIVTE